MLTLFAMPKPFRGHIATIQRNAIGSWVRLHQCCQVLLFGEEEGTAEVAREFGICHIPQVARNEYGTPLLSDLFQQAQPLARHDLLCYVNCDIVLGHTFLRAVEMVRQWSQRFLMVGECWNLDVTQALAFDQPQWADDLARLARQRGKSRGPFWIDYFVFPRGLYEQTPPFALGRAYFDNWLIWKARALGAAVVDATPVVLGVHQNHDYSHVSGGQKYTLQGEEAKQNLKLGGGMRHRYLICDATHRLQPTRVTRKFGQHFRLTARWEYLKSSPIMGKLFWRFVELTRPIRHPLGLRMATMERLTSYMTRQK